MAMPISWQTSDTAEATATARGTQPTATRLSSASRAGTMSAENVPIARP